MLKPFPTSFSKAEFRQTPIRKALLTLLDATPGPLSVPDILVRCHQLGHKANKTTLYRALSLLEQAGVVRRVIVSDRTQYFELVARGHHHHLICTTCETIQDIVIEDVGLMTQAKHFGKQIGFSIEEHTVEFYGRCAQCLITS